MGIHRGPNTVKDGLVFGYDTGYGVADNSTATRFYPGEATANLLDYDSTFPAWPSSSSNMVTLTTKTSPNSFTVIGTCDVPGAQNFIYPTILTNTAFHTLSATFTNNSTETSNVTLYIRGASNVTSVVNQSVTITLQPGQSIRKTLVGTVLTNNSGYTAAIGVFSHGTSGQVNMNVTDVQFEEKTHATPFVIGTRSSTASLIDLKKTANIDVSNVSFDSTGQPIFDGSNDKIVVPNQISTGSYTYETVVKISSSDSSYSGFGSNFKSDSSGYSGVGNGWVIRLDPDGGLQIYTKNNSTTLLNPINISGFRAANVNKYIHLVYTYSNGSNKLYLNGVLQATGTGLSGTTPSDSTLIIGAYSWGISSQTYYINAHQPIAKLYNQTHTATEIKQNYNAYKNRFDI